MDEEQLEINLFELNFILSLSYLLTECRQALANSCSPLQIAAQNCRRQTHDYIGNSNLVFAEQKSKPTTYSEFSFMSNHI